MSEQKTHAEIIAEMRFHGQQNIDAEKDKPEYGILTVEGRITQNYAAELDAAHKREVEDAERRGNHAATKAICDTLEKVGPLYDADSIGNAAKLREALVLALSLLDLKEGVPYKTVSQKDIDFMKAALAAPARNCDRLADFNEAIRTFAKERPNNKKKWDMVRYARFAMWLLALAEKGENNGSR